MQYIPPLNSTDPNAAYVEGNPAAGVRGSYPTARGFEATMREVVNAIAGSGLTPTDSDLTQLLQAIEKIVAAAISDVKLRTILDIPPPGTGFAGTQARTNFDPSGPATSVLTTSFTAPCAGTIQAFSILVSSVQPGFSNAIEIDVGGTPIAGSADSVGGTIINVTAASVGKGDVVTLTATATASQAATYNTTHRFAFSFIPS